MITHLRRSRAFTLSTLIENYLSPCALHRGGSADSATYVIRFRAMRYASRFAFGNLNRAARFHRRQRRRRRRRRWMDPRPSCDCIARRVPSRFATLSRTFFGTAFAVGGYSAAIRQNRGTRDTYGAQSCRNTRNAFAGLTQSLLIMHLLAYRRLDFAISNPRGKRRPVATAEREWEYARNGWSVAGSDRYLVILRRRTHTWRGFVRREGNSIVLTRRLSNREGNTGRRGKPRRFVALSAA